MKIIRGKTLFDPASSNTLPISTVRMSRIAIFQPTVRPTLRTRHIKTKWGTAMVKGRLGQRHQDLLELVLHSALDHREDVEEGFINLLFDPYTIRKRMSNSRHPYSVRQMNRLFLELREASIAMRWTDDLWGAGEMHIDGVGAIIDTVKPVKTETKTRNGEAKNLCKLRLNEFFVAMFISDLQLIFDPQPITVLKSGITKACVRQLNTHNHQPNGGWKIDTVLKNLSPDETLKPATLRKRRLLLKAEKAKLSEAGYEIDEDRIKRKSQ